MTGVTGSLNAKLFIAGVHAAATDTATEFDALTWTEVGEITVIPEFGTTFQEVQHVPLSGSIKRRKGAKDYGSIAVQMARVSSDQGQTALRAAVGAASNVDYDFKIELDDKPAGANAKPTRWFVVGPVMSSTININDANSIVGSTTTIGVNDLLEAAATTGA